MSHCSGLDDLLQLCFGGVAGFTKFVAAVMRRCCGHLDSVRRCCSPVAAILCFYSGIKSVFDKVIDCGLIPVATVCDQGTNNTYSYILTDITILWRGCEIVPLFDSPHLTKGSRNNLLTKKLEYVHKPELKREFFKLFQFIHKDVSATHYAKWDDIKKAYRVDKNRMANSRTTEGEVWLEEDSLFTAEILSFFNKLFDSINGSPDHSKSTAPFYGFKSFSPRNFNQDDLESTFGWLRQRSCNKKPSCRLITSHLRSFLIDKVGRFKVRHGNTEHRSLHDDSESVDFSDIISTFNNFLIDLDCVDNDDNETDTEDIDGSVETSTIECSIPFSKAESIKIKPNIIQHLSRNNEISQRMVKVVECKNCKTSFVRNKGFNASDSPFDVMYYQFKRSYFNIFFNKSQFYNIEHIMRPVRSLKLQLKRKLVGCIKISDACVVLSWAV
ncbi:Protein of unknown function [Cotesia congregata]|uniref:Transposable element P transposase n=1 Tax=Cotesia congregata TaxID=51543 RepID=A0A8J2EAU4_COTCN|nr:Protein of unknown function [Cotesia congregata]